MGQLNGANPDSFGTVVNIMKNKPPLRHVAFLSLWFLMLFLATYARYLADLMKLFA